MSAKSNLRRTGKETAEALITHSAVFLLQKPGQLLPRIEDRIYENVAILCLIVFLDEHLVVFVRRIYGSLKKGYRMGISHNVRIAAIRRVCSSRAASSLFSARKATWFPTSSFA